MKKSYFEQLGVSTSMLGYGCMRFPEKDGRIDRQKGFALIDHAYRNHITYFDTAYPYHNGDSEKFVGEALCKYPRESFQLATKMPLWLLKTKEDMERIFDEQLKRLQTDYIDFYLLHNFVNRDYEKAMELDVIGFCAQKKKEGKIKHLGFSFHDTPEVLKQRLTLYPWDFIQLQVNYVDWEEQRAKEACGLLKEKQIPLIVMEPVKGGSLAILPPSVAEVFQAYAPEKSLASWAFRWLMEYTEAKVILSGMSDLNQLNDNIETFESVRPLKQEEKALYEKALFEISCLPVVPCTGCRYCMPCPAGVDIPGCFSILNEYIQTNNGNLFCWHYDQKPDGQRASACIECGQCVKKCPQNIDIPEELKRVTGEYGTLCEKKESC